MSTSKVVLGVLAGAAAGAILGILFAPEAGETTRQKISESSTDVTDSIKEKFGEFVDSIASKLTTVKTGAEDLYEKGKSKVSDLTGKTEQAAADVQSDFA